jgi:hypothetical protein
LLGRLTLSFRKDPSEKTSFPQVGWFLPPIWELNNWATRGPYHNVCMRLFVGVPLPNAVIDELSAISLPPRSNGDGLRWSAPESWHTTLQFLGNSVEESFECVVARLREVRLPPVLILGSARARHEVRQRLSLGGHCMRFSISEGLQFADPASTRKCAPWESVHSRPLKTPLAHSL